MNTQPSITFVRFDLSSGGILHVRADDIKRVVPALRQGLSYEIDPAAACVVLQDNKEFSVNGSPDDAMALIKAAVD